MPISPPTITSPFNGANFTTNVDIQNLTGAYPSPATSVYVNGSTSGVTLVPATRTWSYTTPVLVEGETTFEIKSSDGVEFSPTIYQTITYTPAEKTNFIVSAPSGVYYRSYIDAVEIVVEEPLTTNPAMKPVGYNFYYSLNSGSNYAKLNLEPLRTPTEVDKKVLEVTEEVLPDQTKLEYEQLGGTFVTRATVVTEVYQEIGKYIYRHTSNSPNPLVASLPGYYFVTALYQDNTLGVEVESIPSEEIVAQAVLIDTRIKGLPQRNASDIAADYINYVYETDPNIDLAPGSFVREIYIEPFANEVEKLRFLIDFYSRCQSFYTLVQIDDLNGDGFSDPVPTSLYKQRLKVALGFTSDDDVQRTIDEAFIKLAGNLSIPKKTAARATGFVTIQAASLKSDIAVSAGAVFSTPSDTTGTTAPVFFVSDVSVVMSSENSTDYYNPSTGFYEITIPVTAQTPGITGNVEIGQISRIVSGVSGGAKVTNYVATKFGRGAESNASLAERSILAFVGADSGTRGGYLSSILKVNGVINSRVVSSGDPLMVRDLIPIEQNIYAASRGLPAVKHVWGTVDIYVQGIGTSLQTDIFSILVPEAEAEIFKVESDILFQISCLNKAVSYESPIISVTKIYNYTRNGQYDLTNLDILNGTVLVIDSTIPVNAALGMCETDVIRVDYSYFNIPDLVFSKQPMDSVISITGQVSGDLSQNYNIFRKSHPLYEGRSTKAGDYIKLFLANNKPSSTLLSSSDTVTLIEEYPIPLSRLGILYSSIVVKSLDGLTTYVKDTDYVVILPTISEKNVRIRRLSTGSIPNATQVFVSYQNGENISVTYSYFSVPNEVSTSIEQFKHIDADVLVKDCLTSSVNIEATVIKVDNYFDSTVDFNVRSAIQRFFSSLRLGDAIHESDIISVIDNTFGVDYVITPLTLLNRANDTLVLDEKLSAVTWNFYRKDISTSYITSIPLLKYKTVERGGEIRNIDPGDGYEKRIVGIREGYLFYPQASSASDVSRGFGRSYIMADGRVLISTIDGENPELKDLYATYYVYGELGTKSIFPASNEILTLGSLNLRYLSLADT